MPELVPLSGSERSELPAATPRPRRSTRARSSPSPCCCGGGPRSRPSWSKAPQRHHRGARRALRRRPGRRHPVADVLGRYGLTVTDITCVPPVEGKRNHRGPVGRVRHHADLGHLPHPDGSGSVTHRYRTGGLSVPAELSGIITARPRPRQPAAGQPPLSAAEAAATGRDRPTPPRRAGRRAADRAAGRELLRVPRRHRRDRADDRHHRARRRLHRRRPEHLLRRARAAHPVGHGGRRRRRRQHPRPVAPTARSSWTSRWPAWSRPARARSSISRPTPTRASSTRSPRRSTPPRPRSWSRSAGAARRDSWSPQSMSGDGRGHLGRGGARRDRHGGGGRQRVERRRQLDQRRGRSTSPPRARTRSPAAAPPWWATPPPTRSRPRWSGTRSRSRRARAAAACRSATRSRPGRRPPGCPRRRPAAPGSAARPSLAAASPMWPATPTRTPATRSSSTASRSRSAAPRAVAPLWAGLIARLAQASGTRFGLLQPLLYAGITPGVAVAGFHDIVEGGNGAYKAGPGWDACTGLGSPNGTALLSRLSPTTNPTPPPTSPPTRQVPPVGPGSSGSGSAGRRGYRRYRGYRLEPLPSKARVRVWARRQNALAAAGGARWAGRRWGGKRLAGGVGNGWGGATGR